MSNQKGAISNDALAILVIVAIVLTVGSFGLNAGFFGGGVPVTGFASTTGTATATVSATTVLTFTVSTVEFGSLDLGNQTNTSADLPANPSGVRPFTLQNDGSVDVNITISATTLFSTKPTSDNSNDGHLLHYNFNVTWNETSSTGSTAMGNNNNASFINVNASQTGGWRSMPGAARWMANCTDFSISSDSLNLHINVTVPNDEPSGAKSSTVTVVSTQAATGSNC